MTLTWNKFIKPISQYIYHEWSIEHSSQSLCSLATYQEVLAKNGYEVHHDKSW